MSLTPPLKRPYSVSDNFMIQHAKTLRAIFMDDQAAFVLRDADFTTPYEIDWNTVITAAELLPNDEMVDDLLTQKTAEVEAMMTKCREKWMDTKPFIKKTFPDSTVIQNEFGFNDYQNVDHSQQDMVDFFKLLHPTAVKYSAELVAKNYSLAMIADIKTVGDQLDAANTAQEKFKKDIPVMTENRVKAHILVYGISQRVCETGKLIHRDSYANYQKYLLPASDESPAAFIVKGKVTLINSTPAQALEDVIVTVQELGLNTQTDSNGNYGFGILPPGTYTLRFHKAGFNDAYEYNIIISAAATQVVRNVAMVPQ